jgi:uncharacterized protein (TIGR00661 family)
MKGEKFNIPGHKTRILIAPLDWGLGHATRCIPIITALIKQHCTVIIAAEGQIKILLKKEFPQLQFIELRGYRVRYSQYKIWMPVKLLTQLPKIIYRIYAENRWLKRVIEEHSIDAVISDNRMGLYNKQIPCIYITHQLTIKTGNRFTESIAQKIHYHFINKFKACWVPDAEGILNLAGALSHPVISPKVPVTYLGPLSRFEKKETEIKYDICIILSGPEPQRKIILIRGLPQATKTPELNNASVEIKNYWGADELNDVIQQSKIIISRCGYSTVMDLVKLQQKAILVPTPGQTEQQYLGRYLQQQKLFFCVEQENFSLTEALGKAAYFEFNTSSVSTSDYETVIENFAAYLTN